MKLDAWRESDAPRIPRLAFFFHAARSIATNQKAIAVLARLNGIIPALRSYRHDLFDPISVTRSSHGAATRFRQLGPRNPGIWERHTRCKQSSSMLGNFRSLGSIASLTIIAGALALFDCGCSADSGSSSSGDDVNSCSAHTRPATVSTKEVSFQRDVIPIFQTSCAFSSCHSSQNMNGVYLGVKGKTTDGQAIRTALLDQKSKAITSMPYVTPSNPTESFLLRKLDGDLCNLSCTNDKCGERMPKGGDALDAEKLQTIESWIQSGAPDN
jgi:hypothetical protein